MSGVLGGIGQLIGTAAGGNARETDRAQQLKGYGDLSNIFNFGMNQGRSQQAAGQATTTSALEQLGGPAAYYQKLLSGNRPAVMQAVAPTVNAANAQADAQRRNLAASGAARGGGVNAIQQQADVSKQGAIDTAVNEARGGAAQGATGVASATAGVGSTQLSNALRLLGLGEESATNLTSLASQSRIPSAEIHNKTVSDIGAALASILTGMPSGQGTATIT